MSTNDMDQEKGLEIQEILANGEVTSDIETLIVTYIHPDEFETALLLPKALDALFTHLQVTHPHRRAEFFFRRTGFRPLTFAERTDPSIGKHPDLKLVQDYREVVPRHIREIKLKLVEVMMEFDLNRLFGIVAHANNFPEIYANLLVPEAKQLVEVLQKYQTLKYLFSFHEDFERGKEDDREKKGGRGKISSTDGFYFYDTCADERSDTDKVEIAKLRANLNEALLAKGFDIYTGIDDKENPELGNEVDQGYVYQPRINKDGERKPDSSFEGAAVELSLHGLSQIERSFVFEIPMHMARERKILMIQIIRDEFILPFLRYKKIATKSAE